MFYCDCVSNFKSHKSYLSYSKLKIVKFIELNPRRGCAQKRPSTDCCNIKETAFKVKLTRQLPRYYENIPNNVAPAYDFHCSNSLNTCFLINASRVDLGSNYKQVKK